MEARSFKYPEECNEVDIREQTLSANPDTLYYDKRKCEKYNLIFKSQYPLSDWQNVIKIKYPNLEESQETVVRLKSVDGTISIYSRGGKIVVHGQKLREQFEQDFEEMVESCMTAIMENLEINNEEGSPDQPEGEDTPSNPRTSQSNPN